MAPGFAVLGRQTSWVSSCSASSLLACVRRLTAQPISLQRMSRILLTGMSGAGKSTLLEGLARRGFNVVDTDVDGWHLTDGGLWDASRMAALLGQHDTLAVAGTAANQGQFYDHFAQVIYIQVPLEVLLQRVAERTNNPYGKSAAEQAEIARYVREVEPLIRASATIVLDGLLPIPHLIDVAERCLRGEDPDR